MVQTHVNNGRCFKHACVNPNLHHVFHLSSAVFANRAADVNMQTEPRALDHLRASVPRKSCFHQVASDWIKNDLREILSGPLEPGKLICRKSIVQYFAWMTLHLLMNYLRGALGHLTGVPRRGGAVNVEEMKPEWETAGRREVTSAPNEFEKRQEPRARHSGDLQLFRRKEGGGRGEKMCVSGCRGFQVV